MGKVAPEELIVHERDGIPRLTLSVSKRVGSTIHLEETDSKTEKVSGWRKASFKGALSYDPKKAQELYNFGYTSGLKHLIK